MVKTVRRLPFLNGIKAFEAAARTGSFAQASAELAVTPAAISRLVRLLEERMGLALFQRKPNGLVLTPAGRTYQAGLTQIFDALANLTAQVTALGSPSVTVGVGPTFAIRWLIPRLASFYSEHPGVEVRITTGGAAAPFASDWTCGINLGDGHWPGLIAEPMFAPDLVPVCAPPLAKQLKKPGDLKSASLLRVAHALEDWPRWLTAAGVQDLPVSGPQFEYYGQALQAAVDGVGVAMGIRPYIDDDLAARRLIAPFKLSVPKGARWYLVYESGRVEEPGFAAFRAWLMRAAQASGAPPKR
jgi:LysR family glycine cleavage system transcriptional activator